MYILYILTIKGVCLCPAKYSAGIYIQFLKPPPLTYAKTYYSNDCIGEPQSHTSYDNNFHRNNNSIDFPCPVLRRFSVTHRPAKMIMVGSINIALTHEHFTKSHFITSEL